MEIWDNGCELLSEFSIFDINNNRSETQYDLKVKNSEKSKEKITVLIHADQLADFPRTEQVNQVVKMLTDEMWKWDPAVRVDFHEKVDRLLKTKAER